MRYLDTGGRDPKQTLAYWLSTILNDEITELRLQSGFFSLSSMGVFLPILQRFKQTNSHTAVLIGSNDCSTLRNDVVELAELMGVPRTGASLGVVNFSGSAYFHPKTFHLTRNDGSQAAFVGSANLTRAGLMLHVEAGISLDTRDGDEAHELNRIANAIDKWFANSKPGMTVVNCAKTIADLFDAGILADVRPPKPSISPSQKNNMGAIAQPKLESLFSLPAVPAVEKAQAAAALPVALHQTSAAVPAVPAVTSAAQVPSSYGPNVGGGSQPAAQATLATPTVQPNVVQPYAVSVPVNGFPPYLLFKPNPANNSPTIGADALTGALLPGNAKGLIIQLNKDSARHFQGGGGTANISIPVVTVSTLRFGLNGKNHSPGSKFNLHMRYLGNPLTISGGVALTSVKGYGYTATETGNQDIRMVVPAASRVLGQKVSTAGYLIPSSQDLALLEWPTPIDPQFRLSFLDPQSPLANQVNTVFDNAVAAGQLVGKGACWLPNGLSPIW
ncbi:restriction endonuclease PLD domain-containing protein [Janthinobacterium agaricidamnosum]|uniref:restriction endonuclease PLD domain-containing protein n=1 Tax=Janthinobacterium agaricidamnosum TaxID=55508 RepID=UPI0013CE72FF|nr:restriction endonuclease PLD domain-containing protein [Janthinobacterium agaricidamnosum]